MPGFGQIYEVLRFLLFRKAVATAFLGISKIPAVNSEIHSFSRYSFKNFCFR